jgi:hypothetical protein
VAAANALGRALARLGVEASLSEASLVRAARRRTGLHAFRPGLGEALGEPGFRVALRVLLGAIEAEAGLHPLGRAMMRQILVRSLASRLRIEALCDRHPEIEAAPVAAPVFIVGLQRTGTTLLHRLLALHPQLRALAAWEGISPAPHLERRARPGARDPRIGQARLAERAARWLAPDFFAVHPILAEGVEEDSILFDATLFSSAAEALLNAPGYSAWLEAQPGRGPYREYRRALQLLLWQRPGRWLGKTPAHLERLGVLLETFPDARIVHTHRDPVETVASLCSMVAHGRGFFSDRVDPREVGRQWLGKARRMLEQGLAARARRGEEAFLDLQYRDLVEEPLKQLRRVCEFIGAPLPAAAERAAQRFLAAHPRHEHGRHAYALGDFGLAREEVADAFAGYRRRFGFAP